MTTAAAKKPAKKSEASSTLSNDRYAAYPLIKSALPGPKAANSDRKTARRRGSKPRNGCGSNGCINVTVALGECEFWHPHHHRRSSAVSGPMACNTPSQPAERDRRIEVRMPQPSAASGTDMARWPRIAAASAATT